ncbi:MAG TPA: BamA/TamA family outer membrane protein [Gemmatimonadales bacterium]|nr:BamA/TamA family outer membrane protein [Gemmatimonadales bacterium]
MRALVVSAVRTVVVLVALGASPLAAQSSPVTRDSVTVVPGPQFSTTSWIRWLGTGLFGARYRTLWNTPITVPVLDMQATGGGLRVASEGTGRLAGLTFLKGADGSHWTFFPLDRTDPRSFPSGIVPASVSAGLIADLTSGRNPAGPLVAAALAEAAGVPNQPAWLVALPPRPAIPGLDAGDPGRAGYLLKGDPVATADSIGAVAPGTVITSLALLHRTLHDPTEVVDARAVLRASLFNVYVGNLAPGFLDWRWEAVPIDGGIQWRPLGTFRETALARYDGIATYLARPIQPDLTTFGPNYPHTLTGIPDQASSYRYLLGALGRPAWDSAAAALQSALTDSVIAAAVGKMPAPYQAQVGTRLTRFLRERRDHLPDAVDHMYRQVRRAAEVFGTALPETVGAEWRTPDSLELSVGPGPRVAFSGKETESVTLFLGGGADTVRFISPEGKAPTLRIVPAPNSGVVIEGESPRGTAAVYGKGITVTASPPDAVPVRTTTVPDALAHLDSTGAERTEGRRNFHPTGWLELSSGVGLLIGGGVVRTDWSGEARPYRNQVTLRAAYGSDSKSGVVELLSDFRWERSPLQLHVEAVASGVGAVYFYGFGNETPGDSASSYYRAGRDLYGLAPSLVLPLSSRVKVAAGIELKSVNTPLDTTLFIGADQPYGSPSFGEAGLTGQFTFDTRDVRGAPRRGVLASVDGAWYPLIRDGSGQFGTASASIAGYHTPHWWHAMTVAARLSGTITAGNVPYFEAAFIGGGRTVRGLPQGRYEGNQAVFGNLDLRLRVSQVTFVLPWDFGVLGLADIGRVFVNGESSKEWHPSFGGGLWVALLDRSLAASLNVATGAGQGVFINAGGGFTF